MNALDTRGLRHCGVADAPAGQARDAVDGRTRKRARQAAVPARCGIGIDGARTGLD